MNSRVNCPHGKHRQPRRCVVVGVLEMNKKCARSWSELVWTMVHCGGERQTGRRSAEAQRASTVVTAELGREGTRLTPPANLELSRAITTLRDNWGRTRLNSPSRAITRHSSQARRLPRHAALLLIVSARWIQPFIVLSTSLQLRAMPETPMSVCTRKRDYVLHGTNTQPLHTGSRGACVLRMPFAPSTLQTPD